MTQYSRLGCVHGHITGTCLTHGGDYYIGEDGVYACPTAHVAEQVAQERARQFRLYGTNEDLLDGTGDNVRWLAPLAPTPAQYVERDFRTEYNTHAQPTWMHLLREEVAEAMQESDPEALATELIQVAAVAVSWVEKLQARSFSENRKN